MWSLQERYDMLGGRLSFKSSLAQGELAWLCGAEASASFRREHRAGR